jgi:hypothetical protein
MPKHEIFPKLTETSRGKFNIPASFRAIPHKLTQIFVPLFKKRKKLLDHIFNGYD